MLLFSKQQNGRKAPEQKAVFVKDDACDSPMPESHGQENETVGPTTWGRHN
jgi:hypothetical protein